MGALAFLTVTIVLYAGAIPDVYGDVSLLDTLSSIHAIYAFGAYSLAMLLYKRQIAGSETDVNPDADRVSAFLSRVRTAQIVRLALYEGAAFMGLVVCMLAAMNGTLHVHPIYWWNVASTAILAGLIVLTFPTRTKIIQIFHDLYGSY
ncbi:MAG: hypothetical protein KF749_15125 [Bacteroidetes bacterium]|nr:hypothetical protein [Bacteroidota bacterium]MCW5897311.1 hypothetical protein [Bacteroidota bacterium]